MVIEILDSLFAEASDVLQKWQCTASENPIVALEDADSAYRAAALHKVIGRIKSRSAICGEDARKFIHRQLLRAAGESALCSAAIGVNAMRAAETQAWARIVEEIG